jgi:hypothetical protein
MCIGRGHSGLPETKGPEHSERKEKRRKRGEGRREKGLLIGTRSLSRKSREAEGRDLRGRPERRA